MLLFSQPLQLLDLLTRVKLRNKSLILHVIYISARTIIRILYAQCIMLIQLFYGGNDDKIHWLY